MLACEIYFKNKVPLGQEHLIKTITKEDFREELEKKFPLLIVKQNDFEKIVNMEKIFYIGLGGNYYKFKEKEIL